VDAGLFDVLHDRADDEVSPSLMQSTSTSVALSRKRSTSTGRSGEAVDGLAHVAGELGVVVNDHHRAAAEHEGRADEHRVADAVGDLDRLLLVGGGAGLGLLEAELVEQGGEELAVLGEFDDFGEVPMIGTPWRVRGRRRG
jgi:hypothetical protein